ncbi:MAG: cox2, partial [Burkholderiales bacterium]|nr:cox2 [Burkholderiales bacterium]
PSVKSFNVLLEIIWTIVPCAILLMIAVPSFALLYSMDELLTPVITLKIVGHQWYWAYQYDHKFEGSFYSSGMKRGNKFLTAGKEFDSNMLLDEDLKVGQLRLLEVNKRTMLPVKTNLRLLVTSADVLHSWAVPSLGIKLDACPGRLNQAPLYIKREGVFYGQCSEICGVNHAFMPIAIKAVESKEFLSWYATGFNFWDLQTKLPYTIKEMEFLYNKLLYPLMRNCYIRPFYREHFLLGDIVYPTRKKNMTLEEIMYYINQMAYEHRMKQICNSKGGHAPIERVPQVKDTEQLQEQARIFLERYLREQSRKQ